MRWLAAVAAALLLGGCTTATPDQINLEVRVSRSLCVGPIPGPGPCQLLPIADAQVSFTLGGVLVGTVPTDATGVASVLVPGSGTAAVTVTSPFLSQEFSGVEEVGPGAGNTWSFVDPQTLIA